MHYIFRNIKSNRGSLLKADKTFHLVSVPFMNHMNVFFIKCLFNIYQMHITFV